MKKVLVAYFSQTGNTERMAEYIAEGVRLSGQQAVTKKISELKSATDLAGYDGYIFGSPTYHRDMADPVKTFLFLARKAELEGKLADKGATTTSLVDLTDEIFMPALKITIPFTDYGEPYLTQSEVEYFLPESRKKINLSKLQNPNRWYIKSGVILISQSGTIGRVTIATKYLERFAISPNPIRLIANEEVRGYLYAFLSSWVGSALIRSPKYGVTVDHILPHHLYNIPVPRVLELEEKINQKILEAHRLKEIAQGN